MPRPFVRPGHPYPGPLPLLLGVLGERGFPFLPSRPSLGSRFRGMGLSGGFVWGVFVFAKVCWAGFKPAPTFAVLGPFTNGPYGWRSLCWVGVLVVYRTPPFCPPRSPSPWPSPAERERGFPFLPSRPSLGSRVRIAVRGRLRGDGGLDGDVHEGFGGCCGEG